MIVLTQTHWKRLLVLVVELHCKVFFACIQIHSSVGLTLMTFELPPAPSGKEGLLCVAVSLFTERILPKQMH